ncbi:MAG: PfkB family carbohydrate kinase [Betaproteobacteria bacterium]
MQIACVGHASIDHVFQIQTFPQRATKTPAHDFQSVGGGMAANAALALARLGAQVRFVGAVGDDDAGRLVRRQLEDEGIDLRFLQQIAGARTSASAIIVDSSGDRQIFNHLGNALARAQTPDDTVFEGCAAVLVDPRWPAGARAALAWARRHRRLAVLDADVAPPGDLAALVPLAQWAVFSEPGLAVWAAGMPHEEALRRALAQGAEHAVVTLGEHGSLHADADKVTSLPAFTVQAVDTTGAGDVFHGALTLALAQALPIPDAFTFASAAAALKCTRPGGIRGAPRAAEVEDFLKCNARF